MKNLLIIGLFVLTAAHSNAQDRGCPGSYTTLKIKSNDSTYFNEAYHFVQGWAMYFGPNDTLTILTKRMEYFQIEWESKDNYDYKSYSKIKWYKDGVELDESFYDFDVDSIKGGNCYSYSGNSTTLFSNFSGVYNFILGDNQLKSGFIQIKHHIPSNTDTTDIRAVKPEIKFYPNPASSRLTITHGEAENGKIQLFDLNAKLLESWDIMEDAEESTINLDQFMTGAYVVRISSDNFYPITKKVIIDKQK